MKGAVELADAHGHLTMVFDGGAARGPARPPSTDELQALISAAREAGVTRILVPGTTREDAPRAVEIAESNEGVFAAVGIHPHEAKDFDEDVDLRLFEELAASKKVVAVGEIGLDFFYDHSPRDVQKRVLRSQVRFARERGLPVILHNRESETDLLPILEEEARGSPADLRGVFHSFCADVATGQRAIALGYLLSFSGMLTFHAAENVRESARALPLESMLVETDAPYLAPAPFRGKPNQPAYLVRTAQKLAEVKGVSLEDVAVSTTAAFRRLFGTA
ncbi:MAG TPA: TatD family hydrolase [Thermoanaerobaculia bacterium]|nr:TatD family hydrolase [Thermoanaerobaculia bacterium]